MKLIAAFLAVAAVAASAQDPLKELRGRFLRAGRSPVDAKVSFDISMPRQNEDKLDELFWAISTPGNSEYGQFRTFEELNKLTATNKKTVKKVNKWLKHHDLKEHCAMAGTLDAISCRAVPASKVEAALKTKVHRFVHGDTGARIDRIVSAYEFPEELVGHVDFIAGLTGFPVPHYGVTEAPITTFRARDLKKNGKVAGPAAVSRKRGGGVSVRIQQTITVDIGSSSSSGGDSDDYEPQSNDYQPASNDYYPQSNDYQPASNDYYPQSNDYEPSSSSSSGNSSPSTTETTPYTDDASSGGSTSPSVSTTSSSPSSGDDSSSPSDDYYNNSTSSDSSSSPSDDSSSSGSPTSSSGSSSSGSSPSDDSSSSGSPTSSSGSSSSSSGSPSDDSSSSSYPNDDSSSGSSSSGSPSDDSGSTSSYPSSDSSSGSSSPTSSGSSSSSSPSDDNTGSSSSPSDDGSSSSSPSDDASSSPSDDGSSSPSDDYNGSDDNTGETPYVTPDTLDALYKTSAGSGDSSIVQSAIEFQGLTAFSKSDLSTFITSTGITDFSVQKKIGTFNPSPAAESTLDVEYLGAVGQGNTNWYWTEAQWMYAFTMDVLGGSNPTPDVMSMSYGWAESQQCSISPDAKPCGSGGSKAFVDAVNANFAKMGAAGITLVAASGDSGAHGRTDPTCSSKKVRPAYPASSPYVTAVGATQIYDGTSGGSSPFCQKNSCYSGGSEEVCSTKTGALITSGGGFSIYATRPKYQDAVVSAYLQDASNTPGKGNFNPGGRGYPDVSALGHNYYIELDGMAQAVDGTSCACPVFAGVLSLLNAARVSGGGNKLGFANPTLYQIAASTPSAFNDITKGDNYCTENGCSGCTTGYKAAAGWDATTGLGTPNVDELLSGLNDLDAWHASVTKTGVRGGKAKHNITKA